ncbi:PREDICTED: GATA transcription factor 5-like [Nicotiana attenuata]|uniref:GATA transcription factor 5-like n=1 Tax=Nicotiana attenuata TaxID=49451 RepID=UPI000904E2ED|nr:PREDICTED: GATA transcription factor 5-like [Nicotiana attenuata]
MQGRFCAEAPASAVPAGFSFLRFCDDNAASAATHLRDPNRRCGYDRRPIAEAAKQLPILSSTFQKDEAENVTNLSGKQDFGELNFPENGEDNLEWVAHFVEDSFTYTAGKLPNQAEMKTPVQDNKSCFTTPVQTGSRIKHTTAARVWSLSLTESTSTSSSSSSTTTTTLFSSSPCFIHTAKSIVRKPAAANKRRKKTAGAAVQWRAGPMGAKTLCNACGVRFKSGRLLPEYRPACSPTFSTQQHSNNHRKVLEMRQKMEVEGGGLALSGSEFLKN